MTPEKHTRLHLQNRPTVEALARLSVVLDSVETNAERLAALKAVLHPMYHLDCEGFVQHSEDCTSLILLLDWFYSDDELRLHLTGEQPADDNAVAVQLADELTQEN